MTQRRIEWQPAGWLFTVVTLAVIVVLCVVALGRTEILVFAAPLVGALAGGWWTTRPQQSLRVEATTSAGRVFEGETVTLTVELDAPSGIELMDVELEYGYQLDAQLIRMRRPTNNVVRAEWELSAARWGRADIRVQVTTRAASGLLLGVSRADLAQVAVFPNADRISAVPRPMDLPDLLGVHLGRRKGEGVEFAGLREYQPGDPLRSVNWQVSGRRGRLHVTERLAEQSAKVVTLIDAAGDIHQHGPSTLELSVHGALAVVQAALRRGDRAGVVALGGVLRWMAPDLGRRHFYRIIEALLDVQPGGGSAPANAGGFPRTVLPYGAAIVVFSPLLDERVISALMDLRRRGFGLVVVDVLRAEPKPRDNSDYDPIAIRMWRLGREGVRHRLADMGIPVSVWAEDIELDEVLRPMSLRPLIGSGVRR
ncbi:DUF58 domain-containing protein [Pseudonocardia spinosispora]|uniref:DUF58 domain-containing protein n=1 Tax=Pseudonocardia spinosispora TaxID=103441 RepID=UPI000401FF8A|nr:DUF58 domain-containing protein [Pseudonocardia spinosispora]